jgi:hypothetical protein
MKTSDLLGLLLIAAFAVSLCCLALYFFNLMRLSTLARERLPEAWNEAKAAGRPLESPIQPAMRLLFRFWISSDRVAIDSEIDGLIRQSKWLLIVGVSLSLSSVMGISIL